MLRHYHIHYCKCSAPSAVPFCGMNSPESGMTRPRSSPEWSRIWSDRPDYADPDQPRHIGVYSATTRLVALSLVNFRCQAAAVLPGCLFAIPNPTHPCLASRPESFVPVGADPPPAFRASLRRPCFAAFSHTPLPLGRSVAPRSGQVAFSLFAPSIPQITLRSSSSHRLSFPALLLLSVSTGLTHTRPRPDSLFHTDNNIAWPVVCRRTAFPHP